MRTHKLTKPGEALIRTFIGHHAAIPSKQNLAAWFVHVERIADKTQPWGDIVLEMPGSMTASGRPERLKIYRSLFDAEVALA